MTEYEKQAKQFLKETNTEFKAKFIKYDFHFVLEEIYRVAKPNCILELHLPYDRISMRTALDHYRTFNWKSFENCEAGNRRNYYINFKVKRLNKMPNKFIRVLSQFFPMFFTDVYFKFRIIK